MVLFCVRPARASADAPVRSGRALMGAPPLALVRSGLDPVSGGALFVSTLVDHKYAHLIANFAHHMHAVLPMVRHNVLTTDMAAQRQCQSVTGRGPSYGSWRFPFKRSTKPFHRACAVTTQTQCFSTKRSSPETSPFSLTRISAAAACFSTSLHSCYRKSAGPSSFIRAQTLWNELGPTPRTFSQKYGFVPNTGLTLSRVGSLPLINEWLAVHRRDGGPQQPALMQALLNSRLRWSNGSNGSSAMALWPTGTTTVALQFLPEPRWARESTSSKYGSNTSNACLFHPYIKDHRSHAEVFAAAGLWAGSSTDTTGGGGERTTARKKTKRGGEAGGGSARAAARGEEIIATAVYGSNPLRARRYTGLAWN